MPAPQNIPFLMLALRDFEDQCFILNGASGERCLV
jgi:hypothetical protein